MIRLDRVTKTFPGAAAPAVDQVTMEVPAGEICVLLGPSGCGKTTTLKMVNRLIEPSSGTILIDGRDTAGVDPVQLRRGIGYVIQQIGLFPNKTVEDNICVIPDMLGWDRRKSRAHAADLLEMAALDPGIFLKRYPKELSGGQQQRIGVLRAIAADPPILLMDEPFGAIDPINREVIQDEFLKMQARLKKTVMFVSHDIDEAVKMGDRIAIFRDGRLVQYDRPDNILAHPANSFVADFVGHDRTLKRLRLIRVADAMMPDPPRVTAEDSLADGGRADGGARAFGHRHGRAARARPRLRRSQGRARGGKGTVGENFEPLPATVRVDEDLRRRLDHVPPRRDLARLRRRRRLLQGLRHPARHHPSPRRQPTGTEMAAEGIRRHVRNIVLVLAFALGAWAYGSGVLPEILDQWDDIVFLDRAARRPGPDLGRPRRGGRRPARHRPDPPEVPALRRRHPSAPQCRGDNSRLWRCSPCR